MTIRRFFVGRAVGFFVVIALVLGFFALNEFIYREKQGDGTVERYQALLEGEYVCLAEAEPSAEPQGDCVPSLRIADGSVYILDFAALPQDAPRLTVGERFSAQGVVTPIERLSTDEWQQYDTAGIFSVTDLMGVL